MWQKVEKFKGAEYFRKALYIPTASSWLKTTVGTNLPRKLPNRISYSALKKDGQRLSVLLKKGHQVEAKPARPVTVFSLTLQEFKPPLFSLDIECGGGFYVRSLIDDLGKALSSCAHVKELIRTKQSQFTLQDHVLHEEQWTLEYIHGALQPCSEGDQRF
ncbi:TruB pseudouridine (psi) synthase 1 [Ataeniobius toweri]|uniref:tRNA pseudouridine(55) synthase n=1 Tax=Ataeniobius toweri TaxID=208326 RepID=A0ABU7AS78_9TELE|nr:TruB pseudouridine (psi) synthase 1 [Ataeniobius toweri]